MFSKRSTKQCMDTGFRASGHGYRDTGGGGPTADEEQRHTGGLIPGTSDSSITRQTCGCYRECYRECVQTCPSAPVVHAVACWMPPALPRMVMLGCGGVRHADGRVKECGSLLESSLRGRANSLHNEVWLQKTTPSLQTWRRKVRQQMPVVRVLSCE